MNHSLAHSLTRVKSRDASASKKSHKGTDANEHHLKGSLDENCSAKNLWHLKSVSDVHNLKLTHLPPVRKRFVVLVLRPSAATTSMQGILVAPWRPSILPAGRGHRAEHRPDVGPARVLAPLLPLVQPEHHHVQPERHHGGVPHHQLKQPAALCCAQPLPLLCQQQQPAL